MTENVLRGLLNMYCEPYILGVLSIITTTDPHILEQISRCQQILYAAEVC